MPIWNMKMLTVMSCTNILSPKNTTNFWKVWNKKFKKSISCDIHIDGLEDDLLMAYRFAEHFNAVNNATTMQTSDTNPTDIPYVRFINFSGCMINFELLDRCLHKLKLDKAAGPDGIMAEHLLYAHPSLFWHLCVLFHGIAIHIFVVCTQCFGVGLTVPLVKDKTDKC
jgi:hypothetical protein